MKKTRMLIALVLCLCTILFVGCGKQKEEVKPAADATTPAYEYGEYIGEPVDENGNQGEQYLYLPEEFEQPAVENLDDESAWDSVYQGEENLDEDSEEDL